MMFVGLLVISIKFVHGSVCVKNADYIGCFTDDAARDLTGAHRHLEWTCTVESCLEICVNLGFSYIGLQYGQNCYCGNSYGSYGQIDEANCVDACHGDDEQKCGGLWINSIYRYNPSAVTQEAASHTNKRFMVVNEIETSFNTDKREKYRSAVECGIACVAENCTGFSYSTVTGMCDTFSSCLRPGPGQKSAGSLNYVVDTKTNLALGRDSGINSISSNPACMGNDGKYDTSFVTATGENGWWIVNLGEVRCIHEVNIVKSNDTVVSTGTVPQDVTITAAVSADNIDDTDNNLCGEIEGRLEATTLVVCGQPITAQYVKVSNRGHSGQFHLAEVEVWGY